MDYVVPKQLVAEMLEAARKKAALSARDLIIRGGSLYITGAPLYLALARLHSVARNRCPSNRSLPWAWRLRGHERERWPESSLPASYLRVLH